MGRIVLFFLSLFSSVQRVFLAALLFGGMMLLPFSAYAQTEEFPISLQGVPESSVSPELFACVNVANDRYVSDVSIRYVHNSLSFRNVWLIFLLFYFICKTKIKSHYFWVF